MNTTRRHSTVRSQLRTAFGPGYQVALDAGRVVRAVRPHPVPRC